MTRRLIVHVGPSKTGTSAIQAVLANAGNGAFCYPKVGLWSDGAHHNLVFSRFHGIARPEAKLLTPDEAMRRLRAETGASEKDVIISSEVLVPRLIKPFIAWVRDGLPELAGETVIAVVLREHIERAASVYNQRVKDPAFGEQRTGDDFLLAKIAQLAYRPLIAAARETGCGIVAIGYHGQDLPRRFVSALGGNPELLPPNALRNVSVGRVGLIVLLEANRLGDPLRRQACFQAMKGLKGFYASGAMPFTAKSIAETASSFQADADFLEREFGLRIGGRREAPERRALTMSPREFETVRQRLQAHGLADEDILDAVSRHVNS